MAIFLYNSEWLQFNIDNLKIEKKNHTNPARYFLTRIKKSYKNHVEMSNTCLVYV